jgi:hypothetical protein
MWESLATTRRQDRVLHGVAKLLNVLAGALIFPVWLVGQWLAGPLRRLLHRFDPGSDELTVPPPRERSMDALMRDLEAIPHHLHPSRTAELRKGLLDWAPFVLAQHRHTVGWGYSYPSQFRHDYFEGADGERVAAMVALHEENRPGLIVVHGLFSNRLFDYVREIAVRAYFDWGFNVAAVDLRSFGVTDLLSHAPSTAGWKEGEDMIFAARHLKRLGSTSVGALGISHGASSVLNAAHLTGAGLRDQPDVSRHAPLEDPGRTLAGGDRHPGGADRGDRSAVLRGQRRRDLGALLGPQPHRGRPRPRPRPALRGRHDHSRRARPDPGRGQGRQ